MKNNIIQKCAVAVMVCGLLGLHSLHAAYKEPASYKKPKKKITLGSRGYSLGSNTNDDSAVFAKAIRDVHRAGGGHVTLPAGKKVRVKSVELLSNVHLRIGKNAVVTLAANKGSMFRITGNKNNVSIRGINGRFKASIPSSFSTGRVAFVSHANNVLLQNIDILDPGESIFSSIELTWDFTSKGGPNNVTVQNMSCNNKEHYGYGIVQAQATKNTKFTNLSGTGGIPCRLETGWVRINTAKVGGVFGVTANNITVRDGQTAVMMEPHTRFNGNVTVNTATAVGSEFSVLISSGSTHKYSAAEIRRHNLRPGKFGNVKVDKARATYWSAGVPTRFAHFQLYSPSELRKVRRNNAEIENFSGPSIAVIGKYGNTSSFRHTRTSKKGPSSFKLLATKKYNHPPGTRPK